MQRNSHCFIGYSHGTGFLPLCLSLQEEWEQGDSGLKPFSLCSWTLGQALSTLSYLPETQLRPRIKDPIFFSFNGIFENIFKSLLFIFLLPFFSPWLSILLTEYHITGVDCIRVTWMAVTMYNLPFQLHVLRHMIFFKFSPHDLQAGKKWTLRQQSSGLKMIWNEMFHIYKHC